ncbi:MAG TPA: hypothetical protein VHX14_07425 [Thermoanaerobaculia bacterium]|jgi:hypothetical protein|nr:hypothetical protein [Thermoanaerobaculia bacterium]
MRTLTFCFLFLAAASALAHPSVSVVVDSRGNVYYSDLTQIWRVAPDGTRSIAVPHVHSHELYLDASDTLYGENLWYNGEALKTWGFSVWKRTSGGRISFVLPPRNGFNEVFSFVRDAAGNQYFAVHDKNEIRKRSPDGRVITMARAAFKDMRWMTVTPNGIVYLIDSLDLVRVTPDGKVTTIARNLSSHALFGDDRHRVQGLWVDRAGNVYVAASAEREVKRVTPSGRIDVVARSTFPWSPSGGTVAPNGDLWVLEYSITNQQRVRKVR